MRAGISHILYAAVMIFITACESDVDIKPPEFEQKLVVTGFISPSDTLTFIEVSINRRLYGELGAEGSVGNLSGVISDGTTETELTPTKISIGNQPHTITRSGFVLDHNKLRIEPGKTYSLSVNTDKGLSASATCKVPAERSFEVKADTFSVPSRYEWDPESRRLDIKATLRDIPGEENYYRLRFKILSYFHDDMRGVTLSEFQIREDYMLSDKSMDGKEITVKTDSGLNFITDADSSFAVVYIYNLEKSYYRYHESLKNQSRGDNPFSEATPVYSNINGGLGVFTSYTVDSVVYRIR